MWIQIDSLKKCEEQYEHKEYNEVSAQLEWCEHWKWFYVKQNCCQVNMLSVFNGTIC